MLKKSAVCFGTDPELFLFNTKQEVVGSENVIPVDGVSTDRGKIVRDGVQVEFNPQPSHCRQLLARNISRLFMELDRTIKGGKQKTVTISLASAVKLTPKGLKDLSAEARRFGCQPSENAYDTQLKVGVDGETYPFRAAGGHVHLGRLSNLIYYDKAKHDRYGSSRPNADERHRLAPILDVVLGNTCVLIDRDPNQATRRLHYGRAGEYRLQPHGFEYRTLSNFWLQHYSLMSFVMSLARMGVSILEQTLTPGGEDMEAALLKDIDFDKLIRAIDTNDAALAKENFEVFERFIRTHVRDRGQSWPLSCSKLPMFKRFVADVEEKGLSTIFPNDPISHWMTLDYTGPYGWETFIQQHYGPARSRRDLGAVVAERQRIRRRVGLLG